MAYNETVATVVGTVVSEIVLRSTMDGKQVAHFVVISTARRYDKESGQWVDGDSLQLPVSCWDRLAQNVHASLHKGDPVLVTGRLATRSFESQGQQRTTVEMSAKTVGPDLSRSTAVVARPNRDSGGEQGPELQVSKAA